VRAVESDVQDPAGNAGVDDRGDFMTVLAGDLDGERVDVVTARSSRPATVRVRPFGFEA
jgi:hypothetical protein